MSPIFWSSDPSQRFPSTGIRARWTSKPRCGPRSGSLAQGAGHRLVETASEIALTYPARLHRVVCGARVPCWPRPCENALLR
jgi:hypothetical protein